MRRFFALLTVGVLAALLVGRSNAGEVRSFPLQYQTVLAEDITAEAPVFFRAMRFNEATGQWNVDLVVTNQGERSFTQALLLTVEGFSNTTGPLAFDGVSTNPPVKSFIRIDLGSVLAPGRISPPRTIALGFVEGAGAPRLQLRVFAVPFGMPHALALTRSLNEAGQPLAGVRVTERGPQGDRLIFTDPEYGVVTLGQAPGEHTWEFELEGHLPVWRQQTLLRGAVRLVPNPRLVRRDTNSISFAAGTTNHVQDVSGRVRIEFTSQQPAAPVTLTVVDGQTLPGLLPQGWSPLRAFWVESTNAPLAAVVALKPEGPIAPTEIAALVKWNADAAQWEVQARLTGGGTNIIGQILQGWGAYALVVADSGSLAPPQPVAGQPLFPSTPLPQPAPGFTASGTVTPASSLASRVAEQVTGTASVLISNSTGLLPSGLTLRTEVTEDYRLQDSSTRFIASYENFITAYRRPAGTSAAALNATFPMRPLLLFGGDELAEAFVRVEVLPPDVFRGGVFDLFGGSLTNNRIRISGVPGDFATPQAALVRSLASTNLPTLLISGQAIAAAFDLTLAGVEPGRSLSLHVSNLAPNRFFILSRILSGTSFNGLEPVERLRSGTNGVLTSMEPASGDRLPGLRGAGQYLLVQVSGPHGLIGGLIRNAQDQPASGVPVRVTGQPWLTFSTSEGSYLLVAPTGAVQVAATDLASGETDFVDETVEDPSFPVAIDLGIRARGPRVSSVTPPANAHNVARVTPIVVTFSKPVNPATLLNGGLQLMATNGQPVQGSLTLNLRNTIATLLPTSQLEAGAAYIIRLSTNLTDLAGLKLEGQKEFSFDTARNVARTDLAKLTIFEPGATNVPQDIRSQLIAFDPVTNRNSVVAAGSPGTAEAGVPVILVNETSGESSTVLSKLDGSFFGFVRADVEDFVAAVFVNANGTRNTVPATEQRFDDGRVGLYRGGGMLEAEGDGGPVQVQIDPGVVTTRSTFKLEPLSLVELLNFLRGTKPQDATLLGGFRFKMDGDAGEGGSHVEMPVDVANIPLGPGETAENGAYALAIAREVDGKMTFQIVDKMRFVDGKLMTASPPFDGMVEAALRSSPAGQLAAVVLSATFMSMYLGQGGVTVAGRAIEVPEADLQSPDGNLASDIALFIANQNLNQLLQLTQARPLSGVFVTLRQPGRPQAFRAGNIADGVVYSTTDRNGRYAMISPLGLGSGIVSGFHPRFGYPLSEPLIPFFDFQIAGGIFEKDLIFTRPLASSSDTPPRLSAGHTPYYPTPSNSTVLEITASHASGPPTLIQVVEDVYSLVPGITVDPQNDLRLENIQDTVQGNRIRRRITVRSDKPVGAYLRLTASVAAIGGPAVQTITHVIEFLGEPAVGTNAIVAADPNDDVGPAVAQSDPPPGGLLTLGDPITVRFNEPIDKAILQNPQYISVNALAAGVPSLRLSPDQQTLTISFARLEPDKDYTLTIQQAVMDLRGNQLDQRPREEGNQEYTLNFHTSKLAVRNLPGVEFGGGVVMNRHFVFALDRSQNGSLRVFNAIDPANPLPIAQVTLPGPPRDLVFIPQYSFRTGLALDGPVQTRDLLAVVGGELGSSTVEQLGDVTFEGQFLRVFDVTDPANPTPIVRTIITRRPDAVTKIRWQPPYLAYLESGQLYEVGFIDLQEMILGFSLSLAEREVLPENGIEGLDKNRDGDYVDAEETAPVPPREPFQFFGKKFGFTPTDGTTQKLLDFDFNVEQGRLDWLGVTLSAGNQLISLGLFDPIVGPAIPPGYRTLKFQGVEPDPETATLSFGVNAHPKRLVGRLGARLSINGTEEARAVVLVSLSPDTDGVNKLAVIDISLPDSPRLLRLIPFPATLGLGPLQTITERPDGLLALATTTDTVLLDERRLAEPNPANNGLHPSIVGVIPGTGSGNISLGGNEAELFAVNLGGRSQLVQAAPRLEFVTFTGQSALVNPSVLADNSSLRQQVFSNLAFRARLFPARYRATGGAEATLSPPAPEFHYHVLVYAPGGADAHRQISLGLQSLNRVGDPYRNKGSAFPPVQAMSSAGLAGIGQELRPDCDAPTMPVKAYRVSNDPKSELYNLYLSEPFALTYERMSRSEVQTLQQVDGQPRHVLWSGFDLRAFIDPSAASDAVVGPFAAVADAPNLRLNCPAAAQVECFPGAYIVGPNPPPVGGDLAVPGSFGTINAANGEFRHSTVDVELPSRLMNIRFVRTAANQDLIDGAFGPGWDFNYNQHLIELRQEVFPQGSVDPLIVRDTLQRSKRAQPGDVKFVNGAGRVILFKNLGTQPPSEISNDPLVQDSRLGWLSRGGRFFKPDENEKAVFDLLYKFPEGQFVRLTPGGMQYFYDKLGRLEKIYHRYEKNHHVLSYNERGELIRIEDKSVEGPRHIDLGYYRKAGDRMFDAAFDLETDNRLHNGRIARIVDYAGREVKFEYSPNGVLELRLGPPLARINNGFEGRPTTTYLGDNTCGQTVGVTAGIGANGGGNNSGTPLFAANMPANNNGVPVAAGGTSASGAVVIHVPVNNTAANVGGSSTTSSGPDQENNAGTEISFDDNGYPSNVKMTGAGVGNGAVDFATDFNDFGLLESVTYPEGNSLHYVYFTDDAVFRSRGNLKGMEIRPGSRSPAAGTPNPLAATFGYDKKYNQPLGQHQDFNGFAMNYVLTTDRRSVASVTYSTGEEHKFEQYNEYGQLEREITVEGVVRQYGYDQTRGFATSRSVGGLETDFGYDDNQIGGKLGMPTTKSPPQNTAIQMEYDARLQMTLWKRGDYEEKRGYDENGNAQYFSRTMDTGELYEEENTYTQINFLEKRIIKNVEVGDAATPITITCTPDDAKRIRQIQVAPAGVTKTFRYDHLGNLIQEDTGGYFIEYAYDKNNNLTGIKPKGTLTRELRYDGYDRAREMIDKTGQADETTTFSYFGAGQLRTRKITSAAGGDVEDYEVTGIDALGRPTKMIRRGNQANSETSDITYTAGNGLTTVITGPRDATTIIEDSAGRLTRITDSLTDVTYHPNANRQIERIESAEDGGNTYKTFYDFNTLDQLARIRDDVDRIFDFGTPRLDGQPKSVIDARGKTTTLTYTRLGEMKSVIRPLGVLLNSQYDVHRLPKATLDAEDKGNRYSYDATLRLEKWNLRSGQDTKYDAPTDLNNQPKAISYPGGGNATLDYDNLGRVTKRASSHDGQDYEESGIVYDAFDRVRSIEYTQGAGAPNSATFGYDLMGPLTSAAYDELNDQYPVAYTIDTDGTYKSVTYPSGTTVSESRQPSGRLSQIADGQGSILAFISFKGANLPLETRLGANIIERNDWDKRRRLLSRRYTFGSTNGAALADLRYTYDSGFNPVVRQFIHRHGRADLFTFDDADRLDFFEHGARPVVPIAGPRSGAGLQGGSGFAKGLYARDYTYGNSALDLLTAAVLFNPDGLARQGQNAAAVFGPVVPAFAATLGAHDSGFKLALDVDGFQFAAPDGLGNARETRFFARPANPGAADSAPVPAEFFHNARNDLVRVERADGVKIEYHYQPGGLMHHRTVSQGATTLSSTHFVWDRARLIEEWDTTGAQKRLRARYFYADGDAPAAADLPDGAGGLLRRFYLRDHAESVIAVANAQGQVIERVHYDAWGQPVIENQDTNPPAISSVRLSGNILLVAFTETVMPPLNVPAQGLATVTADPSSRISITSALGPATVTTVYQENEPGFVFGSVLRLTVSPPLTGSNLLTIQAGAFVDEWGNANPAIALPLNTAAPTAPILHTGPAQGGTAGGTAARSAIGNPFLFQGQYFDYDTGLIYMRARWYDPFTGHFLERDPMQYEDSPNLYAGFGNNPVTYRDPTGTNKRGGPGGKGGKGARGGGEGGGVHIGGKGVHHIGEGPPGPPRRIHPEPSEGTGVKISEPKRERTPERPKQSIIVDMDDEPTLPNIRRPGSHGSSADDVDGDVTVKRPNPLANTEPDTLPEGTIVPDDPFAPTQRGTFQRPASNRPDADTAAPAAPSPVATPDVDSAVQPPAPEIRPAMQRQTRAPQPAPVSPSPTNPPRPPTVQERLNQQKWESGLNKIHEEMNAGRGRLDPDPFGREGKQRGGPGAHTMLNK